MWPDALATSRLHLVFEGTMVGSQIRSTFDYQLSDAGTVPKPIDKVVTAFLADDQFTALKTAWLNATPSDYRLDYIAWQWFGNNTVFLKQRVLANGVGVVTPAYTANVQATIVRRGQLAERRGVGSIRVPAAANSTTTLNGELTVAYKATLQALADKMKDVIICTVDGTGNFTFIPSVYTKYENPIGHVNHIFSTFVQPELRVIRRRTARLGI